MPWRSAPRERPFPADVQTACPLRLAVSEITIGMSTSSPPSQSRRSKHPVPVMRLTFYDRCSSFMMATVMALIVGVVLIIAYYLSVRKPTDTSLVPLEYIEDPGGFDDGSPDETLNVESPEDPIPNASPVEEQMDEEMIEETLESVVELADRATQQVQQVMATDALTGGTPGSAVGTGGRPLGDGPGTGGLSREQRWFIRFANEGSVDDYAKQLDFFGIELGALFVNRGELIYLSNLASATPSKRVVTTGGDQRLYMNWQGGTRREADAKLFERAGVDVTGGVVLHFYPKRTEELLARLEMAYANRPVKEIRRTYFVVVPQGSGYTFAISQQHYFR
jgi:hypothetical protein